MRLKRARKKTAGKQTLKKSKKPVKDFVEITNTKVYGKRFEGIRIYFEGGKPKSLQDDGVIKFGKHILELLSKKFEQKRFRWIITPSIDSITTEYNIIRVRTSQKTLGKMNQESYDRTRDIKNDIITSFFSTVYPHHFKDKRATTYIPGTLSGLLGGQIISRLSANDREALERFLPEYIASESTASINLLKAKAQIQSLTELADGLEKDIARGHSESWWQNYIKGNILIIQQGYISAIEKMNIGIGGTKLPDFSLVTHDNYLDILEIKKPDTPLIKHDVGRDNYFWDSEISKAIIQVENYLEQVQAHQDAIRSYLLDRKKLNLKVLRPRGIILVGNAQTLASQKEKDDFRLLSLSTKNIVFVTYDELLSRLRNYIKVLEAHTSKSSGNTKISKSHK